MRGDLVEAVNCLESVSPPVGCIAEMLHPLLAARELMERWEQPVQLSRCADLLSEAGEKLVGNPVPKWRLRIEAFRKALELDGRASRTLDLDRRKRVGDLPADLRRSYLASGYWHAWTSVPDLRRASDTDEVTLRSVPSSDDRSSGEPPSGTRTAVLGNDPRTATEDDGLRLVARSRPMRRLVSMVDRLRESDLPVRTWVQMFLRRRITLPLRKLGAALACS